MAEHTPGPWRVERSLDGRSDGYIRPVNGHVEPGAVAPVAVARVVGSRGRGETEANARLIAAAPELLAALEELVAWQNGPPLSTPKYEDGWGNAMRAAAAAIQKASGGGTSE